MRNANYIGKFIVSSNPLELFPRTAKYIYIQESLEAVSNNNNSKLEPPLSLIKIKKERRRASEIPFSL